MRLSPSQLQHILMLLHLLMLLRLVDARLRREVMPRLYHHGLNLRLHLHLLPLFEQAHRLPLPRHLLRLSVLEALRLLRQRVHVLDQLAGQRGVSEPGR